jgi:hypothetical protein
MSDGRRLERRQAVSLDRLFQSRTEHACLGLHETGNHRSMIESRAA